jgi:hypothetical protein
VCVRGAIRRGPLAHRANRCSANPPSDPQTRVPVQGTHVQTTTDPRTRYDGQTTGMVPAYFGNLPVDDTTQRITQVQRSEFCIHKPGLNDKYSKLASNISPGSSRFTCFPPSSGSESIKRDGTGVGRTTDAIPSHLFSLERRGWVSYSCRVPLATGKAC